MPSSGVLRLVGLVRADFSEVHIACILCISSQRASVASYANTPSYIPPKRRFLHEPHGVTSQKTAFFVLKLTISEDNLAILLIACNLAAVLVYLH
jgi:hypothetical protein